MDKKDKVVKGQNIQGMKNAFFDNYVKEMFNEVHSIDYIESELGDTIGSAAKYIQIKNGQHINTFFRFLIDNGLGDITIYNNLTVQVIKGDKTYSGIVERTEKNNSNIVIRPFEAFGELINTPATVRLFIDPILKSDAVSSIVYNAIVTGGSPYNIIMGERNVHQGKNSVWIMGKENISKEGNQCSVVQGYQNKANSFVNIVFGERNTHSSMEGVTIGDDNKNLKQRNFVFGVGHDNTYGGHYGVVFGKYSNISNDTAFVYGNGDSTSNRKNLFEFTTNGDAYLYKDNGYRGDGKSRIIREEDPRTLWKAWILR